MTVTLTKEKLYRIPTRDGFDVLHGVFKVAYAGTYASGGEVVDLSPYFTQIFFIGVESTEDAPGYLFYVDDSNFPRSGSAPAQVKLLLYVPCAPHSHTMYAHGHSLAFLAAAGGGAAVTIDATPRLERAGGVATDLASIQTTVATMANNTATAASEYSGSYPSSLACRISVDGE